MKIRFDGLRNQFKDGYRVTFTIAIIAIIICIGLYVGGSGGRGIIIGGLAGISAATFQGLAYRLEVPSGINFDYDKCFSSLGYCLIKQGVYGTYTIVPQFESQKVSVEINTEHTILRSTRYNLQRIVRCISKFTASSPK